ncbi:hypothetical protein G3I40_21685, partial [Streptomyces sp. SID14478]|uniref:hypothetical protein n=1 Tax=Streptomyces sp. SID14478 TaxID=2706073 RepID=UPI0013DD0818
MSADGPSSYGTGNALLWPAFGARVHQVREALAACGHVAVLGVWGSGRTTVLAAVERSVPGGVRLLRLTPGPGDERYPLGALAQSLLPLSGSWDALPPAQATRLRAAVDRPGTPDVDRPALRTAL